MNRSVWLLLLLGFTMSPAWADDTLECAERVEMGTPFKICLVATPEQKLNARFDLDRGFAEVARINHWMSEWQPNTELSKVNAAAGARPTKISKELFQVLEETMAIAAASDGALDPTFNALWGLYNFKKGQERAPSDEELKERLSLIDWHKVSLRSETSEVFLREPGMKLGLGAVGQGYAADRTAKKLKTFGYRGGFIDGSGDTVFWGKKPDGALWTTAIRDPRDANKVITRIYGTDFAITTCGDDEKFFMRDGKRIHHVIDPKTGRSADRSRQVTVIAKRGFDADAWDTAAFVLGPKAAKARIEQRGLRAVMVDRDGGVTMTEGLQKQAGVWGDGYVVQWPAGSTKSVRESGDP